MHMNIFHNSILCFERVQSHLFGTKYALIKPPSTPTMDPIQTPSQLYPYFVGVNSDGHASSSLFKRGSPLTGPAFRWLVSVKNKWMGLTQPKFMKCLYPLGRHECRSQWGPIHHIVGHVVPTPKISQTVIDINFSQQKGLFPLLSCFLFCFVFFFHLIKVIKEIFIL